MKKTTLSTLSLLLLAALCIFMRPQSSRAQEPPDLILQVTVSRPTHQSTRVLESRDEPIKLDPQESATANIQLSPGSGTIYLLAPNGGSINNADGKLSITTTETTRDISFSFKPGVSRGRYTIEVSDGSKTETLEFWIGPDRPLGQPGPNVTFTPTP